MTTEEWPAAEEWRAIEGHDGWYEVSDRGRVRSWKMSGGVKGLQLGGFTRSPEPRILHVGDARGYRSVVLSRNKVAKTFTIHKLVAATFIGPRPAGMVICHNDGNSDNNAPTNLRYDTQKGNLSDRVKHGTNPEGVRQHLAKLDDDKVRDIRSRRASGESARGLALEYQMDTSSIYDVINRHTWKHVA